MWFPKALFSQAQTHRSTGEPLGVHSGRSQIKARAGEMNALYLKTGSSMKVYDDIITKADALFPRY